MSTSSEPLNVEAAVRERYTQAAKAAEQSLCCPVSYDPEFLKIVPAEIIERDYGCGDPSKYLAAGDHVLDLGSGGGKICYIASQVVGPQGSVTGIDVNDEMLALARRYQNEVAEQIGYRNTDFRKGRIQDLQLDLELFERHLQKSPVRTAADWMAAEELAAELRVTQPLVASDSMDAVVSNCVLNLVRNEDRRRLFAEVFRVLRAGGRAIISDIVSDEDVPEELQNDPTLWSGCLSGAFREDRFLEAFEEAGFHGLEIVGRQKEPWAVVDGIEFRSLTVRAWKGSDGRRLDRNHSVIYNGPWKAVMDDDGHELLRGQRMAVSDLSFERYQAQPYASHLTLVHPAEEVPLEEAMEFSQREQEVREAHEHQHSHAHVQEKGTRKTGLTILPEHDCCGDTGCCE